MRLAALGALLLAVYAATLAIPATAREDHTGDEVHYLLHHYVPTNPIGRRLRELHMRHHFQDDTRGFGISAPYWDRVFRTNVRAKRR